MSMKRLKRGSVGLAVVALVALGVPGIAGAAAKSSSSGTPTIKSFKASPSSLASAGGSVTLSATVTGGTTCALSSTTTVPGLPPTVTCGTISVPLTLPANTTTKAVSYKFTLSATATKTAKATTTVKVAALVPPSVVSFSATPTSLPQTGGSATLSASVTGATSCAFSVSPTVTGLPDTVPCTSGTATVPVTLPANTTTKAAKYTFALSAIGATTVKATSVNVTVAAKAKTKSPKPKVISFTAAPQTLQADGGPVLLAAEVSSGNLCTFSSAPTNPIINGFPVTEGCPLGSASTTVNLGPNIGYSPETFTFNLKVTAPTGSGTATKSVTVTIEPEPTSLTISPTTSSIAPGGSQTYVVTGYDEDNNSLGVDTDATLDISGTGTCEGFTCTANDAGSYTVTATDGFATADATLNVDAVASLTLSPNTSTIAPDGSQTYVVTGYDADGNNLGPDINATLAIAPDGSCTGYTCTASALGPHTVTGTDGTATGQASLAVEDCSNLVPYADLEGCDLSGQNLNGIDLTGADL